jgi:hypothetical protein
MLLVKQLIKYDPEDALPVSSFQISTLPETGPDTSCLDILNFFQEGRSHMALVSDNPGGENGVLGVITLEDVIEELIGEVYCHGLRCVCPTTPVLIECYRKSLMKLMSTLTVSVQSQSQWPHCHN